MHDTIKNIAVFGASGTIGTKFITTFRHLYPDAILHGFSRQTPENLVSDVSYHAISYEEEAGLEQAAADITQGMPLDLMIVATGILHDGDIMPEKSLRDLSAEKFHHLFQVNTVIPALIAKHFLPKLNKKSRSVFAALSARVGSISDNHLGGWYAYRLSKAALNMMIRNAAIETGRRNKEAIIVGLHPGTVDSPLSKPFQSHVPEGKLFTPDYAVEKLTGVIQSLTPEQSGQCFGWDGKEIQP